MRKQGEIEGDPEKPVTKPRPKPTPSMCGMWLRHLAELTPEPVHVASVTASTGALACAGMLSSAALTACGKLIGRVTHSPVNFRPLEL